MGNTDTLIREFLDFNSTTREKMHELKKKTGKKMIGWTCNYVPTELILAAGMIPVRILSRPESITVAEGSLPSFCCNIARSYLDQLLKGELDYLDGVVTTKICDCLQYCHEAQKKHGCASYSHYLQMPAETVSTAARIWWDNDMKGFIRSLEEFSGNTVTEQSLKKAIELSNATRSRLRNLYKLREGENPLIYGHQVLHVVLAGMMAPTAEYNQQVDKLLAGLGRTEGVGKNKIRLMVIGSTIDFTEMEILQEFEKGLGVIVTDDMCTGSRWISLDVATDKDPLDAITDRYHHAGFCAARYPSDVRFGNIKKIVKENNVQGVVIILEKFCDPFGFINPDTEKIFEKMNVKTLLIESAEASAVGQVRTRAQGLFETIRGV
jgi:benzoyl-CoA reductase subunit C